MISVETSGSSNHLLRFMKRMQNREPYNSLESFGKRGVDLLSSATPVDTGETASSWYYEIERKPKGFKVVWYNRHVENDVPIAIIIQYGHATGNGAWVEGQDYINPAMRPLFDKMAAEVWKEVTRA